MPLNGSFQPPSTCYVCPDRSMTDMSPIESVDQEQKNLQDRVQESGLQGEKKSMKRTGVPAYNEDTILTGKRLLVVFIAM